MSDENIKNEFKNDLEKDEYINETRQKLNACFDEVNDKALDILEDYITEGYLETLANLLIYIGEERKARALSKLPEPVRKGVEKELAKAVDKEGNEIQRTEPKIIHAASFVYKKALWYGETMANDILEKLNERERKELRYFRDDFFYKNPILEINTEYYAFMFNDLCILDDRALQKVLREVEEPVLAKALLGADENVQNKVFRNMSRRAETLLKEDMEFMGPVRTADIEEAQTEIINIVKNLEDSGEIVIAREGIL